MKVKPGVHSVDTFIHTYKHEHPEDIVPSTKTLYSYIHQGLLDLKAIDLPKVVRIHTKAKVRPSTKKHLGTSIEDRAADEKATDICTNFIKCFLLSSDSPSQWRLV